MTGAPGLLTREQERELFRTLKETQATFRKQLLEIPHMARKFLDIVNRFLNGEGTRIDWTFDVKAREKVEHTNLMRANANTICQLLVRDSRHVAAICCGSAGQPICSEVSWAQISRAREKIAQLLLECKFKWPQFNQLWQYYEKKSAPLLVETENPVSGPPPLCFDETRDAFLRRHATLMDLDRRIQELKAPLFVCNQGLVASIAKSFASFAKSGEQRLKTDPNKFNDFFHAGQKGLFIAMEKFDLSYNTKFSTYATHWIKQAIRRSIFDDRTVRLPSPDRTLRSAVNRVSEMLSHQLSRRPSDEEVAEACKSKFNLTALEIGRLRGPLATISLSHSTGRDNDSRSWEQWIPDRASSDRELELRELRDSLSAALAILDERSREILMMRAGGDTLAEVGKVLNVTRQRVMQLEERARAKIRRRTEHSEVLRQFFE